MKEFAETVEYFTSTDHAVLYHFVPKKMSSLGLAKVLHHGLSGKEEVYTGELAARFLPYFTDQFSLYSTKGKNRFPTREREEALARILKDNMKYVVGQVFNRHFPKQLELEETRYVRYSSQAIRLHPNEYREYRASRLAEFSKFQIRMQNVLQQLASRRAQGVVDDYLTCQQVVEDKEQFPMLEALCAGPLYRFVTQDLVRPYDRNDQYQEGLLAIWSAAPQYEGRNFSRFSNFIRAVLKKKYMNMLRYSLADKRVMLRKARPAGGGPDDSFLAQQMDDLVAGEWKKEEREELNNGLPYDPFHAPSIASLRDRWPVPKDWTGEPREELIPYFEKDGEEGVDVNDENFPHLNEKEVLLGEDIGSEEEYRRYLKVEEKMGYLISVFGSLPPGGLAGTDVDDIRLEEWTAGRKRIPF